MNRLLADRELSSITASEWSSILKQGIMRGQGINRMTKVFDDHVENLFLTGSSISFNNVSIDLQQVKISKYKWNLSRLIYEIALRLFPSLYDSLHNKVDRLAEAIYLKLNPTSSKAPFTESMISDLRHLPIELKLKIVNTHKETKEAVHLMRLLFPEETDIPQIAKWASHSLVHLSSFLWKERARLLTHLTYVNLLKIDYGATMKILPKLSNAEVLILEDKNDYRLKDYITRLASPEKLKSLHLVMPNLTIYGISDLEKLPRLQELNLSFCPRIVLEDTIDSKIFLQKCEKCHWLSKVIFYNHNNVTYQRNAGVARTRLLHEHHRKKNHFKTISQQDATSLTIKDDVSKDIDLLVLCEHPEKIEKSFLKWPH